MVRFVQPGPTTLMLFETRSSPLVNVILDPAGREKLMTSPSAVAATAVRSVPGPLSPLLVTVIVAARALGLVAKVPRRNAKHDRKNKDLVHFIARASSSREQWIFDHVLRPFARAEFARELTRIRSLGKEEMP